MKQMGFEANQLIEAGRQAFRPTEADKSRLMAALVGTAALSAGAAAAANATQRSLSGIFSVAPVARILAVALPLAAAGVYGLHAAGESAGPVRTAAPVTDTQTVARRSAPPPVQPPQPEPEALTVAPPIEPSAPVAPVTPERASAAGESKRGVGIRQEVALLSSAQAALSRGRPEEALQALAEHAARFPRGMLVEESAAARARTLCALGRKQEAEKELKLIEKRNPGSAYLARARESCGL